MPRNLKMMTSCVVLLESLNFSHSNMSNIRKGLFAFCVRKTEDFLIEACGKCLKILSPIEDLQPKFVLLGVRKTKAI